MRSRSILYAVLALIVAAAMAALGFWQLQRAGAKEALLGGIAQAMAAPVMNFSDVQAESPDLRFRAVSINGQFDPAHQVLLDNQLRDGQPGVRVYVPFAIAGQPASVLVDRGWLAWPNRRAGAPQVRLDEAQTRLTGMLLDPPGAGLALGATVPDAWPLLVTRMDMPDLQRRLARPLLDWVLEDRDAPRAQSIRAGMLPPERHRGYAVQWFGLALTVLVIYGVLALRAWRHSRDRNEN